MFLLGCTEWKRTMRFHLNWAFQGSGYIWSHFHHTAFRNWTLKHPLTMFSSNIFHSLNQEVLLPLKFSYGVFKPNMCGFPSRFFFFLRVIFGHLMRRVDSLEMTLMLGGIGGRRRRGQDEMAGWHHRLDGHEFVWTPGVGDGQGGLACCDSWGHKESDTTERLNWTELRQQVHMWPALSKTVSPMSFPGRQCFIYVDTSAGELSMSSWLHWEPVLGSLHSFS